MPKDLLKVDFSFAIPANASAAAVPPTAFSEPDALLLQQFKATVFPVSTGVDDAPIINNLKKLDAAIAASPALKTQYANADGSINYAVLYPHLAALVKTDYLNTLIALPAEPYPTQRLQAMIVAVNSFSVLSDYTRVASATIDLTSAQQQIGQIQQQLAEPVSDASQAIGALVQSLNPSSMGEEADFIMEASTSTDSNIAANAKDLTQLEVNWSFGCSFAGINFFTKDAQHEYTLSSDGGDAVSASQQQSIVQYGARDFYDAFRFMYAEKSYADFQHILQSMTLTWHNAANNPCLAALQTELQTLGFKAATIAPHPHLGAMALHVATPPHVPVIAPASPEAMAPLAAVGSGVTVLPDVVIGHENTPSYDLR